MVHKKGVWYFIGVHCGNEQSLRDLFFMVMLMITQILIYNLKDKQE